MQDSQPRKGNASTSRTFSEQLKELAAKSADRPTRLSELLQATQERGYDLLLVLITLPFLTPIPIPGFSTVFGTIVAVIGARLALGRKPWLPSRILARELPPRFVSRVLLGAARVLRGLEYCLKPRLIFLQENLLFRRVAGALIMFSGLFLLLPLPIPFTNSLPAVTILLLAAGALERDGVFFLAGVLSFTCTTAFFLLLGLGGAHAWDRLRSAFGAG